MKRIVIGASLLALAAPAAYAQQRVEPAAPAASAATAAEEFRVFFDLDQATLDPEARQVVAEAAETYQTTGAARVVVTGHTDLSGSAAYNLALSQRRAEAVERELVQRGVPAADITTIAAGETEPLVATADGEREPRNRRVEIEIPVPPAPPPPAPVAAAPPVEPMPAPAAGPEEAPRWELGLGGFYGYNLRETDDGNKSQLAGGEVRLGYLLTPNVAISLEQAGFRAFDTDNDGWGGRSVIGLDLQGDFGNVHPYIGVNFGGVYGKGVQDGLVAGPEVGLKVDMTENFFLYGRAAYDYQFRNDWEDWDRGIVNGGLGVGFRF